MRRLALIATSAWLAFAALAPLAAHDIPRDVVVHAFVAAEGEQLRVTLRMPASALRDIQFPRLDDGSIDAARAEPELREGIERWVIPALELRENGLPLAAPAIGRITVLPMGDFEALLAYPIHSARSAFSIRPGFERLGVRVLTSLKFQTPDGAVRAFELRGDPGVVPLDPRWHQASWRFIKIGFVHILDGADHLLFLFCLVIPFRRIRALVIVVTAFTAAHSIALAAAALNFVPDALWFPPLVEMLIAASILYMAIENVVASAPRHRVLMAFAFGLVHGFGFSFALKETMQFAGAHLLTSLFSFNLGVEAGQLAVLLVFVPAIALVFRFGMRERIGIIVLSALAGHVAWHWMAERWSALRQFPLPAFDESVMLMSVRALIAVMIAAMTIWLVRRSAWLTAIRRDPERPCNDLPASSTARTRAADRAPEA